MNRFEREVLGLMASVKVRTLLGVTQQQATNAWCSHHAQRALDHFEHDMGRVPVSADELATWLFSDAGREAMLNDTPQS